MQHPHPSRQELLDIHSPLADMPRDMPFHLPHDYFTHTLPQTLPQVSHTLATEPDPAAEIQALSPRLAQADRTMPFTLPAEPRIPTLLPTPPQPTNPAQPATLRRLTPLRTAAAVLLVAATAGLLRLQTRTNTDTPQPQPLTQTRPTYIDSLAVDALDSFLQETDVVTASQSIGVETGWSDDAYDILLGNPSVLDSSLSTLPEATLLAYDSETQPPLPTSY